MVRQYRLFGNLPEIISKLFQGLLQFTNIFQHVIIAEIILK